MRTINLAAAREPVDLAIRPGDIARGVMGRPAVLRCRRGTILATIEGDRKDYQLEAGDSLLLPVRKLVVVEGNASIRISVSATP